MVWNDLELEKYRGIDDSNDKGHGNKLNSNRVVRFLTFLQSHAIVWQKDVDVKRVKINKTKLNWIFERFSDTSVEHTGSELSVKRKKGLKSQKCVETNAVSSELE